MYRNVSFKLSIILKHGYGMLMLFITNVNKKNCKAAFGSGNHPSTHTCVTFTCRPMKVFDIKDWCIERWSLLLSIKTAFVRTAHIQQLIDRVFRLGFNPTWQRTRPYYCPTSMRTFKTLSSPLNLPPVLKIGRASCRERV